MHNTENNNQKAVQFSGEEFVQIGKIAKLLWERGTTENPPKFVVFMGGIGSGKTTMRRRQFASGYVHFDFGEFYTAIKKVMGEDNPKLTAFTALASEMILQESIEGKKNIVIEVIGEALCPITPVIDKMKEIGYAVSLNAITCDPAEAYERHMKAVDEDKDYISAYFTQEATLSFFYGRLDLGAIPK